MKNESIIKVENLTKVFRLPHERLSTAKQHFVSMFSNKTYQKFIAVDNISFEVKRGEFFGIIGANGSGKSTLLKLLAKIYQPTSGKIEINGSLSPFIELGVGFNPDLTARENVYLNAAILGLSKKETEEKFNEIIEFSELGDFVEQKLKNFSSGMQVRLAFSIAVQAHADILLVDEVLAVGDAAFQEKCLSLFKELKKEGKTIIFVSHALNVMEEFCDRVLYIQSGKAVKIGDVHETVLVYLKETSEEQSSKEKAFSESNYNNSIKITSISFLDEKGKDTNVFQTNKFFKIRIKYKTKEKVEKPVFGIAIYREDGVHVNGPNTKTSHYSIKSVEKIGYIDYQVNNLPLLAGHYFVTAGIFNESTNLVFDFIDKGASFRVIPSEINQNGLLMLNDSWKLNG